MPSSPRDLCKGFRECYNAILRAIVINPVIAGICMGIPTYFLLSILIFQRTTLVFVSEYAYIQNTVTGPFYTLLSFTILAWCVELIGIKWMMPNLLNICAFCHAAVGSWWLVNLTIVFFAGWSYIPFHLMFTVIVALAAPSIIWHTTGDIIRAYKRKLVDTIALHRQSLAQQSEAFTIGTDKV
jgi:hypothetical protein